MNFGIKRILFALCALLALAFAISGCSVPAASGSASGAVEPQKLSVVVTSFPCYDFVRAVAKDNVELKMLLKPGVESHSFEPTPMDIKSVDNSSLFVYVGGDSDEWVDSLLESTNASNTKILTLMSCVELAEEELAEGMTEEHGHEHEEGEEHHEEGEEHEHEGEYDEHVWTSPKNAVLIVNSIRDALCELDPNNADFYTSNAAEYVNKLNALDAEFQSIVDSAERREIIVADRFPLLYFAREYGLTYHAAFPGCATDVEASAATIAFLIDKTKSDKIPVVFHIELSNEKICDLVCESTGAKKALIHSAHNVTREDFDAGVTYADIMEENAQALREALN